MPKILFIFVKVPEARLIASHFSTVPKSDARRTGDQEDFKGRECLAIAPRASQVEPSLPPIVAVEVSLGLQIGHFLCDGTLGWIKPGKLFVSAGLKLIVLDVRASF